MTIDAWLAAAKEDARQRQLPDLLPLLEGLAAATTALRSADDDARAADENEPDPEGAAT